MNEKMREKVKDHLMARPISSIYISSMEQDADIALKMMCIVDYYLEKHRLYPEIEAVPKLLGQILKFWHFGLFRYVEYKLKKTMVGTKLLQCESCEFIGPYITTLEHMILSHNRHVSGVICQWCKQTELRTHEQFHTLENCYVNYASEKNISNYRCADVIEKFYNLMSNIANRLGVRITRAERFKACDIHTKEIVTIVIDDDKEYDTRSYNGSPDMTAFRASKKTIDLDVLENLFSEAMFFFNISNECDTMIPLTLNDDSDHPDYITARAYYSDHSSTNTPSPQQYNPSQMAPQAVHQAMQRQMPLQQIHHQLNTLIQTTTQSGQQSIQEPISQPLHQPIANQPMQGAHPIRTMQSLQIPSYMLTPPIQVNDNLTPPINQASGMPAMNMMNNDLNKNGSQQMNGNSDEMVKFANLISATLNSMNSESLKQRAKFQIHQLLLQLSAEDLNMSYRS